MQNTYEINHQALNAWLLSLDPVERQEIFVSGDPTEYLAQQVAATQLSSGWEGIAQRYPYLSTQDIYYLNNLADLLRYFAKHEDRYLGFTPEESWFERSEWQEVVYCDGR